MLKSLQAIFEKENTEHEKSHVSYSDFENNFMKRRNTYAEHYLQTKRSGSLALPLKFYSEYQRKGKIFYFYLQIILKAFIL
jgi:hypothetical protein